MITVQHDVTDISRTDKHLRALSVTSPRFWGRFCETADGCWEWTGALSSGRYGCVGVDGTAWLTHRYAYTLAVGPIPDGLTIDHLCRNTVCGNPAHLEAVPQRINTLRGIAPSAVNARRAACIKGHALAGHNLITRRDGRRACRTCKYAQTADWRRRKAA